MAHPRRPIVEAGWLAALALTPVLLNPWSGQAVDAAKAVTVRLLVLLMLGGWLLSPSRTVRVNSGPLTALVLGWLAVHALSTITAIAPAVSLLGGSGRGQGLLTIAAYAALLVLVSSDLTSRAQRERAVTVILIASVPVALYAIVQRLGLDPFAPPSPRPGSTLGGPIFLGAYLLMTAPLALARLLDDVRRQRRRTAGIAVHAAVFALQSAALLLTLSRGPFLGFVAALVTLAVLDARMGGARRAAPWVAGCFVAILLTFAGGGFSRLLQPGGATSRVRVLVWEATMRLAGPHEPLSFPAGGRDHLNALRPLLGYGPESLYAALGPFHPDELSRLEGRKKPDRAHNVLLDALATTGALGALAQLALVTGVLAVGLERLGMIRPGGIPRFVAWCAMGAAGAGLLAGVLLGAGWIAPAVGWGMIGGMLAFVAFGGGSKGGDDVILAGLLAGAVGHVVETQVGIATTTSWVHFAFFAGALAARADPGTPDEADPPALYGVITGLILSAVAFQFLVADHWPTLAVVVLMGGTALPALLLTSVDKGASLADAAWFAVLALVLVGAFALPENRLVRRAAAGDAEASVYAVLLFVAFVAIAVVLAARTLHGERKRSAPRPPPFLSLVGAMLVVLVGVVEVSRLWGAVLGWAAVRSGHTMEQGVLLLERARCLQPLDSRAAALVGAAYVSLAERGLPQHALTRAEDALLSARRLDPLNTDYTLDLARLHRAAARLLPAQALERLGKAVACYEAAARLDPAAPNVHLERAAALADHARVLARAGDLRAAADARERARASRARARALQPTSAYKEPID